ncbi:MAG: hypothetical protein R3E39_17810 [Anaerolineae bacterium]
MKTQKAKLTIVLLIVILLAVVFAALYNAYIQFDQCVPGGFGRDVNGKLQAYYICRQNGVEVTQWYMSDSVTEVAVTSEITPQ